MAKIRKLGILSFAKFQAILTTFIGLIFGVIYVFGGLIIDALVSLDLLDPVKMETPGLSEGTLLAFGALLGMPLIGTVIGFAGGILEAIIFNWFAGRFGGIDLRFQ